jgi:hypothetical protein
MPVDDCMSNFETRGDSDTSDWNHAWKVVARLAQARRATLPEMRADAPGVDTGARPPLDQLARDIAEIEQAATALRRAEPTLEPRGTAREARIEAPPTRSIWLLVSVIWLTALVVVSSAIGAAVLLLG